MEENEKLRCELERIVNEIKKSAKWERDLLGSVRTDLTFDLIIEIIFKKYKLYY